MSSCPSVTDLLMFPPGRDDVDCNRWWELVHPIGWVWCHVVASWFWLTFSFWLCKFNFSPNRRWDAAHCTSSISCVAFDWLIVWFLVLLFVPGRKLLLLLHALFTKLVIFCRSKSSLHTWLFGYYLSLVIMPEWHNFYFCSTNILLPCMCLWFWLSERESQSKLHCTCSSGKVLHLVWFFFLGPWIGR